MKRCVGFPLLIILFIVSPCWCQVSEDLILTDKDNFDNLHCGMSKEEIEKIANIKLKYHEKLGDYYTLNYSLHDMPSMAGFKFKRNRLINSKFNAWTSNKNATDLVKDYFRIKKILENEYGEYYYNGTRWKVKVENPTLENYINALENENVKLYFMWKTTKMEINYKLYKDSSDPFNPYIMYIWVICSDDE